MVLLHAAVSLKRVDGLLQLTQTQDCASLTRQCEGFLLVLFSLLWALLTLLTLLLSLIKVLLVQVLIELKVAITEALH